MRACVRERRRGGDGGFCQGGATRSRRVIHAITLTADDKQRQHTMRRPQRGLLAGRAPAGRESNTQRLASGPARAFAEVTATQTMAG